MKRSLLILGLALLSTSSAVFVQSCKKDSNNNSASGDAILTIQTGAQTTQPGTPITYTAVVVDSKGSTSTPGSVSWSASGSGGATIGSFSGNIFTPSGTGDGTITASAQVNGKTLTASVPVGIYLPAAFVVVPSAIIWTTNAGTIPLTTVYIGTGSVTGYTYSSSNSSIATVDGSGNVSFVAAGECVITVTANGLSDNNVVKVPVLVVGANPVSLPVVRVSVTPGGKDMFRGDHVAFAATAYNSSNATVSSTFTWASQDASIASVDASGNVTAVAIGKTTITATASGISGQAEVEVFPDTTILVTPMMASISPGGTKQFTAQAYVVNHSNYAVTPISMPGILWAIPTTGISIFDIATVNSTGLVTMNSSATLGLSTFVIAYASSPTVGSGAGIVMVSDCDCGSDVSGVTHIGITSGSTMNLTLTGTPEGTIAGAALDASNSAVSGATLHFCSDNMAVCTVDASGVVSATGPGTAIVTVCVGSKQTTVTVNVSL